MSFPTPGSTHPCRPPLPAMSDKRRQPRSSDPGAAASSPFRDPNPEPIPELGDKESNPSTSNSSGSCGHHQVFRAPKESRRWRFLPYTKAKDHRRSSRSLEDVEEEDSAGEGILSIGLPPREPNDADSIRKMEFGSLSRRCSSCHRRITDRDSVFMYGVLNAFCSMSCREKKMEMDENLNK